jgi:hypothetical protein
MSPLTSQHLTLHTIEEEKWLRFEEMEAQERAMRDGRVPMRRRVMNASGDALIALGQRMQEAAGRPLENEATTAC